MTIPTVRVMKDRAGVGRSHSPRRVGAILAMGLVALSVCDGCSSGPFASCAKQDANTLAAVEKIWPVGVPIAMTAGGACDQSDEPLAVYSVEPLTASQVNQVLEEMAGSRWRDEGPALSPGQHYWSAEADGRSFLAYLTQTDSSTLFEIDTT